MPKYCGAALNLVFQALADPTRRTVVERLSLGPATVSELAKPLAMALPSVMQHLQILETSGLVRSEKNGRVRTCRLDAASLSLADRWIAERRSIWESRFNRLGDYLAGLPNESNEE